MSRSGVVIQYLHNHGVCSRRHRSMCSEKERGAAFGNNRNDNVDADPGCKGTERGATKLRKIWQWRTLHLKRGEPC